MMPFKKGHTGSGGGRPKGSKNATTIEREYRTALADTLRQIVADKTASADARASAAATLVKLEGGK